MSRTATFALAALGLISITGAASAQELTIQPGFSADPYYSVHKTSLRLSAREMSSPSGAHAALGQIEHAAVAVCGGEPGMSTPQIERDDFSNCYNEAVRHAVASTGAPALSALIHNPPVTLAAAN